MTRSWRTSLAFFLRRRGRLFERRIHSNRAMVGNLPRVGIETDFPNSELLSPDNV
jgi:hypothetical protein